MEWFASEIGYNITLFTLRDKHLIETFETGLGFSNLNLLSFSDNGMYLYQPLIPYEEEDKPHISIMQSVDPSQVYDMCEKIDDLMRQRKKMMSGITSTLNDVETDVGSVFASA